VPWDQSTWPKDKTKFSSGGIQAASGGEETAQTGFYRVVRNGLHVSGLTNGMVLKGDVVFPIEIGAPDNSPFVGITFYGTNNTVLGAMEVDMNAIGVPELVWDTTSVPNGTYSIHAEADFRDLELLTNQPVSVTVSNYVSFPNYFTRIYGGQMWVYAEIGDQAADWEIKMYNQTNGYMGSFSDSTTDGIISFVWDLTDGGSTTFDDTNFSGAFFITPSGAASPTNANATRKWIKESSWNGDNFLIAWGSLDNEETTSSKMPL